MENKNIVAPSLQTTETFCEACSRDTKHQLFCKADVEQGEPMMVTLWARAAQCLSCGRYVDLQGKQPTVTNKEG